MTQYHDRLTGWPGLVAQPPVGSREHDMMIQELAFAVSPIHGSLSDPLVRDQVGRAVVRFMVGRNYWPLGTRFNVFPNGLTQAIFPITPEERQRLRA